MRASRLGVLAAAAAAVAMTAIPAVSSVAEASPAPGAGAAQSGDSVWKEVDAVAQKASALGVSSDSDPVLMLPAGTPATDLAGVVASLPAAGKVAVRTSQFSKSELDSIQKTVMDRKFSADAGKYGISSTYDAKTDKVVVTTDAPASVTDGLNKSYAGKVEIHRGRFESQNGIDRFNDGYPFYGGISLINSRNGGVCTAGVAVESVFTGQRALTTAAHCDTDGDTFMNKDHRGHWGQQVGSVDMRDTHLDVSLLHGLAYDGWIYTGGTEYSTSKIFVHGGSGVWNGLMLCVSGQTTFNHCGHPVSNTNYSIRWSASDAGIDNGNGFLYDQGGNNAPFFNNGKLTEAGDSGAPIFDTDQTGSAAFIAGTHSGVVWLWDGGRCGCSIPHMVGSKIGPLLQSYALGLVTH
ncbi:hypothetical protein ACWEIJ_42400 [Lentzea sp. NPDC004789]